MLFCPIRGFAVRGIGMQELLALDWQKMFVPSTPVLEMIIRGTIIYLGLFFLLRAVMRREAGTLGITDLLVIVLLADAAQNAMAGDYTSITDGVVLIGTIVFWSYALQWASYHIPAIRKWVDPPPLLLVRHGKMNRRNMRKELITEEELMSQLRLQGAADLSQVKEAHMEGDGRVSVITYEKQPNHAPDKKAA